MQDCVVWMGMKGFDVDDMLDMDVLSFNDLLESAARLDAIDKADNVYGMLMASQGEGKQVLKWVKQTYLQPTGQQESEANTDEFVKRFGGGM